MRLASYVPGELIPLPLSGSIPELPHVAKVENRTTLKISRKLIFRLLCCCLAIQRRYEGPWSISDGSIWSLTSPRVKRISGSKNFRSTPQKDFCNKICHTRTSHDSFDHLVDGREKPGEKTYAERVLS
jgi:hypothetical protein